MSLFKIKEVYSKKCGSDDEFTAGSLGFYRHGDKDLLLVGSLSGYIRLLDPTEPAPHDDILEHQVGAPVYQIAVGKFVSNYSSSQVAVLTPRALKVYYINVGSGASGGNLELAYEHSLERSSYNITLGRFGQAQPGRDYICVQSIDGILTFFEQETRGISCTIPKFLLPGPLLYFPSTDSLITCSCSHHISSYKYQNLAATEPSRQSSSGGKTAKHDWQINIGEIVVELQLANFEYCSPSIIALGERSIYCLSDSGVVRFMKKLDFAPMCILPYASIVKETINYIVCSSSTNLFVCQDQKMTWSSQTPFVPIAIGLCSHKGVANHLVVLDGEGSLSVGYFGSDPDLLSFTSRFARDGDTRGYDVMMHQLKQLQGDITSHGGDLKTIEREAKDETVTVRTFVPTDLDQRSQARNTSVTGEHVPSVTAKIRLESKLMVNDVHVSITTCPPLTVNQLHFRLAAAGGGQTASDVCPSFYMEHPYIPPSLEVQVSVSYHTSSGASRTVKAELTLPLLLVCYAVDPIKTQDHKLTLDAPKGLIPLSLIFPEFVPHEASIAVGLKLFGGPVVTVLTATKTSRYRLQSDEFEALWLIANEMRRRVCALQNDDPYSIVFSGQLPVQELSNSILQHFELRQTFEQINTLLAQRATQLRMIQKRLLAKFKDKNAGSLMNMDALLEGTYRQVISLGDAAEENEAHLLRSSCALSSAVRLILLLCDLLIKLSSEEKNILSNTFSPESLFTSETKQGWEEQTDASVTYLLKTTLSKDSREDGAQTVTLEHCSTPDKFLKHVDIFFSRVLKGGALVPGKTRQPVNAMPSSKKKKPVAAPLQSEMSMIEEEEAAPPSFEDPVPPERPNASRGSKSRAMPSDFIAEEPESSGIPDRVALSDRSSFANGGFDKSEHFNGTITAAGDHDLSARDTTAPIFSESTPASKPSVAKTRKPQIDAISDFFD